MNDLWQIFEDTFDPQSQHHKETIFTIGNGYLATRGAFEEGYPDDRRGTFVHGVFDDVPIIFTELVNAPDWLPFIISLEDERFSLDTGTVEKFRRSLDLRTGVLTRIVHWKSPGGRRAEITFERFISLADQHTMLIRCQVVPKFEGVIEFRASLNGNTDTESIAHWHWIGQGIQEETIYLHNRTRNTQIELASAMRFLVIAGKPLFDNFCNVENTPTRVIVMNAHPGEPITLEKCVSIITSRDTPAVVNSAIEHVNNIASWQTALEVNTQAWAQEWALSDVVIEGDEESQTALRFNIFQLLIAAPRHDDRVSIGAKTLSGFGYRGHIFWDTEIFMLPMFTYNNPHIARNMLNYRYRNLTAARQNALSKGFEGARFPWESADTGEEVTPTWVPNQNDRTSLIRIWTGDIQIHISADIAYATYQYWKVTGDDDWFVEKGAEINLDTAKFWASRAEWNTEAGHYEYNNVIGPDEYHEHVDNNAFTNRMAQWNLQTALEVLDWLESHAPSRAIELINLLDLSEERLARWRHVIANIYLPVQQSDLIEQFDGYFNLNDIDLAAMEPRHKSIQSILGIEGANQTQVIKQPDVLILLYLLEEHYSAEDIKINYDYYTPRTDHTYGSSLGPSIQSIMACRVGKPNEAYEHFIRAARTDLQDVRGNTQDGIHAASAGGLWQSVVFGFAGLHITPEGWSTNPTLPTHWRRLKFHFLHQGELQEVDIKRDE
ncbi:MAG: glycoside hydrolase family 65 protein [Chloroflexota bacterium]|nr:glycoside hydrolase family 65 protein [Chloroflexota bacterium]